MVEPVETTKTFNFIPMHFILKPFGQLTVQQLFEIYKLRSAVFVVEQNCAYQDIDDKDLEAFHLLMLSDDDVLAGYCRILSPGVSYKEPAIGRVVVDENFRGTNYGKLLMKQSINETLKLFTNQAIVISAQLYLLRFYTELGFIAEGEEYDEDEIPHIKMRYNP